MGRNPQDILTAVKTRLSLCDTEAFFGVRPERTSLADCAPEQAIVSLTSDLIGFTVAPRPAFYMYHLEGARPEKEYLSDRIIWVTGGDAEQILGRVLTYSPLSGVLDKFPPDFVGRPSRASKLDDRDSILAVIEAGWEAGISRLRRVAGALCAALPLREAGSVAIKKPDTTILELNDDGSAKITALSIPVAPVLARSSRLTTQQIQAIDHLAFPRSESAEIQRLSVALEFLSAGWVASGSQAFMNYFIALDALTGAKKRRRKAIRKKMNAQSSTAADSDDHAERVGLLTGMRNDLLHNRCSDVRLSEAYLPYVRRFGDDPIEDLFRIVRECCLTPI